MYKLYFSKTWKNYKVHASSLGVCTFFRKSILQDPIWPWGGETACIRYSARHLRGGGGTEGRHVVDIFPLWETHTIYTERSVPTTSWGLTGIWCVAARRGPSGSCQYLLWLVRPILVFFLIVSHRWEYQPTPLSLRTLRPSVGRGPWFR